MRVLQDLKGEPEPPEVVAAAEPPPGDTPPVIPPAPGAAEPAAVPAAAATPPAETPPPASKTIRSIAKNHPLLASLSKPEVPALAPALPPPTSQSDATLTEEQREEIAEADVAARLFPDRYKEHPDRLRAWYGNFQTNLAALLEKNPNVEESDDEYQALLRNKPAVKPVDARKVQRKIGEDGAARATEERLAPRINKIEMEARRSNIMPEVQHFVGKVFGKQLADIIANDAKSPLVPALKAYMEKGEAEAEKLHPLAFNILRDETRHAQTMLHEFLLMRNGAAAFDDRNPYHMAVSSFITEEGQAFQKKGGRLLVQEGRNFLPREQFLNLYRAEPDEWKSFNQDNWTTSRYWTFTDTAVVDMMGYRVKEKAEKLIDQERERAKRYGFANDDSKRNDNPPPPEPTSLTPPRTTSKPSPGAAVPSKTPAPDADSAIPVSTIVSHLKKTKL